MPGHVQTHTYIQIHVREDECNIQMRPGANICSPLEARLSSSNISGCLAGTNTSKKQTNKGFMKRKKPLLIRLIYIFLNQ